LCDYCLGEAKELAGAEQDREYGVGWVADGSGCVLPSKPSLGTQKKGAAVYAGREPAKPMVGFETSLPEALTPHRSSTGLCCLRLLDVSTQTTLAHKLKKIKLNLNHSFLFSSRHNRTGRLGMVDDAALFASALGSITTATLKW